VRRALTTVGFVLLASVCAECSPATAPVGAPSSPPSVRPSQVVGSTRPRPAIYRRGRSCADLRFRARTPRSFDGEEIRQVVTVRNLSHRRCEVRGYPLIRFTSDARPLRYRDFSGGDSATGLARVHTVTLAPNAVASFAMDLGQSVTNNGVYCRPVTDLEVQLSGRVGWQTTPDPIRVCGNGGTVTAIVRGTDGPQRALASPDRPVPCTASNLRGRWGPVGATTGTEGATLTLTSIDDLACVLNGYPTIRRLDADHQPMPTHVHHRGSYNAVFPDPGPRRIILNLGSKASTELSWADMTATRHGRPVQSCRPSQYLTVGLPHQSTGLTVRTGSPHGQVARTASTPAAATSPSPRCRPDPHPPNVERRVR